MSESFQVGQQLWYVPAHLRNACEFVTISKIGRKWMYFERFYNEYRFSADRQFQGGFIVDGNGHNSPGTLYVDKEAYEARVECERAFSQLREKLGCNPQPGVTAADVLQAAELLNLPLQLLTNP